MHHFLRDRGFLIKVPPSWRVLYARRRKLQRAGVPRELVAQRLGVNQSRWEEIERACSVGVVPLGVVESLPLKTRRPCISKTIAPGSKRFCKESPVSDYVTTNKN